MGLRAVTLGAYALNRGGFGYIGLLVSGSGVNDSVFVLLWASGV